jgi:hypothetical protein
MSNNNKKPVSKVTLYPISAAIWRNENAKGDTFFNVTFERSYKDDEGIWQSASTFNAGDLLLLAKVADRSHSEVYKLRAGDRAMQQIEAQQVDE